MARGYLPDIPLDLWAQDQSQQFEQYTQQQDEAQKFREQTADISAPAVGTWPDPYEVLARPQPDPEPFYSPAPPAQDTTSPVPDDGGLPSPDAMAHYYGLPSAGDSGPNDFLPQNTVEPVQPADDGADFTPHPTDSASSLLPSPDEMAQQYGLESPSGDDRPSSSSPVDPSAGAAAPQEAEGFLPQFTKAVGSAVGSAVKSIFGDRDSGLTGALNATSDNLAGALNREAAPTPEQVEARIAPYRDINPVHAGIEYNKPLQAFREEVHNVGEHLGSARESLAEQGPTPGGIGGAVGQTALAGLSALNTTFSPIKAAVNQWFPEGTGIETPAGTITPGDIVINATLPRDAVHVAKGLLHVGQGALDLLNSARSKEQAETVIQGLAARAQAGEGIAATAKGAESPGRTVEDILPARPAESPVSSEAAPPAVQAPVEDPAAPTFFSQLRRTVEQKMPNRAAADQVSGILRGSPVKPDELKWTGFDDFLAQAKAEGRQVTKQEALDFLDQNAVKVEEVVKSNAKADPAELARLEARFDELDRLNRENRLLGPELDEYTRLADRMDEMAGFRADTRYPGYQLPGGENYRELLLTLPEKGLLPPAEYDKYEQIVREYGPTFERLPQSVIDQSPDLQRMSAEYRDALRRIESADKAGANQYQSAHWDEPNILAHVRFNDRVDAEGKRVLFVEEVQSDWHQAGREKGYTDLAARDAGLDAARARVRAAEDQFNRESSIPNNEAAERLARSELMSAQDALAQATTSGSGTVPTAPFAKTWPELAMKRVIRWAAENGYDRVAWTTGEQQAKRYPAGGEQGEKIGGGMAAFYDSILPNTVNKLGKKFGARVGETEIPTLKQGYRLGDNGLEEVRDTWRVPAIDITPQMRAGVVGEGQPLFSAVPGLGGGLAGAASEDTLDEEDQSPQDRALRTGLGFAAGMAFHKNKPDPRLLNHADPAVANFVRQFHAKAPELNPIGTVEKVRRGFVKEFTDRLVDLGAAQADVEKSANVFRWNSATQSLNNYIFSDADRALEWARTNAPVAARQRFQEIEDRVLDLVDRVGARDALRAYIAGRHQLTQDAIYPGRTFPSGLKADGVRDVLDKVEADVRSRPDGDAIWDRVVQAGDNVASYTKDLLRERRDAGIISDELYKDLVTKYPYYVPTKILTHIDQVSNGGLVSSGKRFTLADQDIRKLLAEGTDKEMLDPLKGLALLTLSTKQQIRKNSVFQAIDRWREIDPDFMGKLITEVPHDVDYDARTHALFPGWVNGEKKYLQVPAALAPMFMEEPLARIGPPQIGTWMSMVAGTITRKFPPFALVGNPMMDLASYGIRAGTWELAHAATHGNPLDRTVGVLMAYPRVMADIAQAIPDVFEGLGKGRFYGATAQLRESGGGQAGWFGHGMDQKSLESLDKAFEDLGYRPLVLSSPEAVGRAIKDLASFTPVEALGERFELIPRVAAYKGALRRGETELQAMIRGREVTIDFQKGGTFVKVVNQVLPFTNATVQSAAQFYRVFHDNPRAAAITTAAMIVGPTALVEAWNRGDPERAKAWDQVPDSTKYRYLAMISPNPWTTNREGERAPNVILIPTAREFAPIMNLTRTMLARQYGDDHEAWGDLIRNGVVAPLSPVAMNNGTDFINSLLPPPFDVVQGLATDTDPFSGGKLSSKFRAERAGPSAQVASELLNKVPFVHTTAGQTEYAMRNTLGGIGQMVTGAGDLTLQHEGDLAGAAKSLSGGRLDLTGSIQNRYRVPTATETNPTAARIQDTPVVGGLVGRFYRQAEGGDLEKARGAKVGADLDKALSASGVSYRPADMAPSALNVPLTRQELARTQDLANRYFEASARDWMGRAGWDQRSAAEKDQIIRALATAAHQRAGAEVVRDIQSSERSRRTAAGER